MAVQMFRISTEYVWWRIQTPHDLSSAQAEVACLINPGDIPATGDWKSASLISPDDETFGDGSWWVKVLIGPQNDGIELDQPGDYQTWVKIIDSPEVPVRKPGVITIL